MALSAADLLATVPRQIERKKIFRVRRPVEYLFVAQRSSRVLVSRPPMLLHAGAREFVVLRMSFVVSGAVNQMHDVEDLAVRRGGQQLGLRSVLQIFRQLIQQRGSRAPKLLRPLEIVRPRGVRLE